VERSNKAMLFQLSGVSNRTARSTCSVFQGLNLILIKFIIAYVKKQWHKHRNGQTEEKMAEAQLISHKIKFMSYVHFGACLNIL
jgi:hypothetical protein